MVGSVLWIKVYVFGKIHLPNIHTCIHTYIHTFIDILNIIIGKHFNVFKAFADVFSANFSHCIELELYIKITICFMIYSLFIYLQARHDAIITLLFCFYILFPCIVFMCWYFFLLFPFSETIILYVHDIFLFPIFLYFVTYL